jgi:hypothetical protein
MESCVHILKPNIQSPPLPTWVRADYFVCKSYQRMNFVAHSLVFRRVEERDKYCWWFLERGSFSETPCVRPPRLRSLKSY